MKIISINVNGLKSFYEKGALGRLISKYDPDVLCLQETKASELSVGYWFADYNYDYIPFSNSSHWKHGYAGVSILVHERVKDQMYYGYVPKFLEFKEYLEGRIVCVDFDKFRLINLYVQNSGDKEDYRQRFDDTLRDWIKTGCNDKPNIIIGDMNVVPSELDYWGNYRNALNSMPGLMTFEHDNLTKLMSECDLVDSYRQLNPTKRDYSWFSYQGGARAQNKGWRIDLALVSSQLIDENWIESSKVHSDFEGSDHCPIEINIKLP